MDAWLYTVRLAIKLSGLVTLNVCAAGSLLDLLLRTNIDSRSSTHIETYDHLRPQRAKTVTTAYSTLVLTLSSLPPTRHPILIA